MSRLHRFFCALATLAFLAPAPAAAHELIGANLNTIADFSRNQEYVDLVRQSREFGSFADPFNTVIAVGPDGWPTGDFGITLLGGGQANPDEAFLMASERFDAIPPGNAPAQWLLAAVLEEYERLSTFSSFYRGAAAYPRLQAISDLGFASPEMQRRFALVQLRVTHKPGASGG